MKYYLCRGWKLQGARNLALHNAVVPGGWYNYSNCASSCCTAVIDLKDILIFSHHLNIFTCDGYCDDGLHECASSQLKWGVLGMRDVVVAGLRYVIVSLLVAWWPVILESILFIPVSHMCFMLLQASGEINYDISKAGRCRAHELRLGVGLRRGCYCMCNKIHFAFCTCMAAGYVQHYADTFWRDSANRSWKVGNEL